MDFLSQGNNNNNTICRSIFLGDLDHLRIFFLESASLKQKGRGYEQGVNLTNTLAAATTTTPPTTTFIY